MTLFAPLNVANIQSCSRAHRAAGQLYRLIGVVLAALTLPTQLRAADFVEGISIAPVSREVFDRWEMQYDTAVLWSFGKDATPLDYAFLPQILSVKTPQFTHFNTGGGDIVVRARLSLLAEPIVVGPESYYVGFSFSPSIEWWNKPRSLAAFFSVGGGVGLMDAQGYKVAGGQGQDFTLNWFATAGLKYRWNDHWSAGLGIMFQHLSNGGQDPVNPGVNAVGPTLGLSWHF